MIMDEIKAIRSGRKDLRSFGWVMGTCLLVIGALLGWRGRSVYPLFLWASGFFFVCGLLVPVALLPVHKAWMAFGVVMGWTMTRIILVVLFYLIVAPIAVIARVSGKDFLSLKPEKDSYWVKKHCEGLDRERCEKQY